jgi:hypothetical protein
MSYYTIIYSEEEREVKAQHFCKKGGVVPLAAILARQAEDKPDELTNPAVVRKQTESIVSAVFKVLDILVEYGMLRRFAGVPIGRFATGRECRRSGIEVQL